MKGVSPGAGAPADAVAPADASESEAAARTFDPESARQHMGVDQDDFWRLFEYIWREVSERRTLLDAAVGAGDRKAIVLQAHTIKSSAAAIGATGLSQAAAAVERIAAVGSMEELAIAMEAFHAAKEILSTLVGMG